MLQVQIIDLVEGISRALDSMTTDLANHHRRTAIIALRIAELQNFDSIKCRHIRNAALLHDVGALLLRRDISSKDIEKNMYQHAVAGWSLLKHSQVLAPIADIVLYHHTPRSQHAKLPKEKQFDARCGALIGLADTVDMLLRNNQNIDEAIKLLKNISTDVFMPEDIECLKDTFAQKDFMNYFKHGFPKPMKPFESRILDTQEIITFSSIFSYVIDSRSPSTATHTVGVAEQTRKLYELTNASKEEVNDLYVAGLLHDIGKLGVPVSLIEKQGKLTNDEFVTVQEHASISKHILVPIPGFEKMGLWAASHHERLDGKGYPSRLSEEDLPLQARVIAIADILTALTEDRPYRKGMPLDKAFGIIADMAKNHALDADLVDLAHENLDMLEHYRLTAQNLAASRIQTDRGEIKHDIFASFDSEDQLEDLDVYFHNKTLQN